VRQAIAKHARDFVFVLAAALIGLLVGGYILSNQRFYLPDWVPVLGSDFVAYRAEMSSAQAVTPGQGQTVQVAGIDVGEITDVSLEDGRAVIAMDIRRRFTPIYRDASALLRPKSGLNDMVVQLMPGSRRAGEAPVGFTIPIGRTLPTVNFDEILAGLDGDTRDYLRLLIGGAGEGVGGQGPKLAAALRRFEPTGRELARLNGPLAKRRANIRRSIHNFRLLAQALGDKDDELATFVDSSNRAFRAFARQDENLREALSLLPGALAETRTALTKADALGRELGPTLGGLRPAARALGPSLRATRPFLADTTPVIRDQLRPFARDVLPVVRELRPAAADLAVITPRLTTSFDVINELLDALAYNPSGPEEGYLFWTAWANHAGASVFNLQDAHGPIRRGQVLASCGSLQVLESIRKVNPVLGTLADLLRAPQRTAVCPATAQAPGGGRAAPAARTPAPGGGK